MAYLGRDIAFATNCDCESRYELVVLEDHCVRKADLVAHVLRVCGSPNTLCRTWFSERSVLRYRKSRHFFAPARFEEVDNRVQGVASYLCSQEQHLFLSNQAIQVRAQLERSQGVP